MGGGLGQKVSESSVLVTLRRPSEEEAAGAWLWSWKDRSNVGLWDEVMGTAARGYLVQMKVCRAPRT